MCMQYTFNQVAHFTELFTKYCQVNLFLSEKKKSEKWKRENVQKKKVKKRIVQKKKKVEKEKKKT